MEASEYREADLNRQGFEELFEEHRLAVWRYAVRRIGAEDALDVVADTFVVAWRRASAVPDDPLPWLLGVARRVIATKRRSARRRADLAARLNAVANESPRPGTSERVELADAFMSLSDRDREILMLVGWDGLGVQDAARVLGCSPGQFAVRLHRARKRLHERLHHDNVTFQVRPEESV